MGNPDNQSELSYEKEPTSIKRAIEHGKTKERQRAKPEGCDNPKIMSEPEDRSIPFRYSEPF